MADPVPATVERAFAAAEAAYLRGDLPAALDGFGSLLAERLAERNRRGASPLGTAEAVIADRLASVAVGLGRLEPAERLFRSVARAAEAAANLVAASYYDLKAAETALAAGATRRAWTILRALPAAPGAVDRLDFGGEELGRWAVEHPWAGASVNQRSGLLTHFLLVSGRLLATLGRYGEAVSALSEGLRHVGGGRSDISVQAAVPLRLALAAALAERGDLPAAREIAAGLASAFDPTQHPGWAAERLELLSQLDLLGGDLGSAREHLSRLARLCQASGQPAPAARAQLMLAHHLIRLNDVGQASVLIRSAAVLARAAQDEETERRARWLQAAAAARINSLAPRVASATEMWDGRAGEPRPAHRPPPPSGDEIPDATSLFALYEDRELLLHHALGDRDGEAARRILREMRRVFRGSDSRIVRARLALIGAMLAYYRGHVPRSAAMLDRLLPSLSALGLRTEEWQALRFRDWCARELGSSAAEVDAWTARVGAALDGLSETLNPRDRDLFLLNKWSVEEERLWSEVRRLLALRTPPGTPAWRRPFRLLRHLAGLHALLRRMDRYRSDSVHRRLSGSKATPAGRPPFRPGLPRMLATHPADRATLTFLVLPDRVVIVAVSRAYLDLSVAPVGRVELRELVGAWHRAARTVANSGDGGCDSSMRSCEDAAARVSKALWLDDVLRRLPPRVTRLTLVADDVLHGFPFAAVRRKERYLVKDYAITRAFSPFAALGSGGYSTVGNALLAGDMATKPPRESWVTAKLDEKWSVPFLPGVPEELGGVAGLLDGRGVACERMDDADGRSPATRHGLMEALPRASLFHAACHGVFRPDDPGRSGLRLFPPPGREEEVLTLRDLTGLALGRLCHATLSACSVGDSYVLPGRWILSLPETLCRAGAGSVLSSSWQVHDGFARAFQLEFYRALAALPRDRALQVAQVAASEGRLPGLPAWTRTPAGWAGFFLYGAPGPLRFGDRSARRLRLPRFQGREP